MFDNLSTGQIWFGLGIIAFLVIMVLIILFRRGGKLTFKSGAFVIPDNTKKNHTGLENTLFFMMEKLASIREGLQKRFYERLTLKGVAENILESHEDGKIYYQMLGNIIYSGNGINSFKSIIEKALILELYLKKNKENLLSKYVAEIVDACLDSNRKYLNAHYLSSMVITGKVFNRVISNASFFVPAENEFIDEFLNEEILQIFNRAVELNGG